MPVRYLWWWDWRIETINEIPVTFSARKQRPLQAVRGRPRRIGRALPSNPEPATSCLSYLSEGQTMELDHQKHTIWESISEMQVSSAGDSHKPMTEYSVWVRTCPIISEILGMSQTNLPSQVSCPLNPPSASETIPCCVDGFQSPHSSPTQELYGEGRTGTVNPILQMDKQTQRNKVTHPRWQPKNKELAVN